MGLTLLSQGISNDFWNSNQIRYDSPRLGPIDFAGTTLQMQAPRARVVAPTCASCRARAVSLSVQKDENLAERVSPGP